MKTRVIFLAAIFFFLFTLISCQKGVSPFSPQTDVEKKSENTSTTGGVVSTQSKTQDSLFSGAGKKTASVEFNQDGTGDFRIRQGTSDKPGMQKIGVELNRFSSANKVSTPAKWNRNKRDSNREGDTEIDQELSVQAQPSVWNTNWAHSQGLVTVRIFGEGLEAVDASSVRMVGPEGDETGEPAMSEIGPFFVMAKFMKNEAIGIIPEPKPGETYEIQITWGSDLGPEATNGLPCSIRVVGKEYEDGDLTLEIRPEKWNLAWANVSDEDDGDDGEDVVTARIGGEGFNNIDPDTIRMDYPGGGLGPISPIPNSYEFGGVSFVIKFTQSEAISLIPDPKRGDTYQILITGELTDGTTTTPFALTDTIEIIGKKSGEGPLSLEIRPDRWNPAWANSDADEEITARISGEDFDKIDTTQPIKMRGPVGTPIDPIGTELAGFSFIAKFSQRQAIALIPDPPQMEKYEIFVSFYLTDGTSHELSCWVFIKGK